MFENVTVCPSLKFRRLCAGVVVASCVVMTLFMVLAHDWSFEVSPSTASHDRDVIIIDEKRVATREHVSGVGALTGASLYGCILKKTCDVTNSGRNGQLAIEAAAHHHSYVALVTMLHHSLLAQSTHPLILLYVVEDGCALGHLMKDVGVLLEVAALLPTGRSVAVEELHIVFGNRCASRATWQLSDSSLFGAILAPWWRHVIALAAELLSRGAVRTPIHVGFADEWDRWKSTHRAAIGEGSVVVIRRPVRWRWFYQNSHAALLRNAVLLQSDGVTPHYSPPGVEPSSSVSITITIIKRRKNRRINESGIADIAHSIAAPWRHPIIGASHSRPSEAIRVQVVDTEGMSFVDQVRLFANTDILIAAHGAALAFTMFMNPAYAVVIELFPYQFGYWIYEELAMSVGLEYHIVRGQRPSSSCSRKAPCKAPITSMRRSTEDNLYGALRAWNGHSSCKNCDVMWCPTPSTLSMEDQREETLNETICLHRIMVPQLRDVVRRVAVKKIRRGFSLGGVNTTRWLDRRS